MPFLIGCCVREVEKRGINEVGIYRISGSNSDVQRLRKSFENNPYEAEQLLKEVDVNAVAHLLKLYLRELPEALFTDELYPNFFEALSKFPMEYHAHTLRRSKVSLGERISLSFRRPIDLPFDSFKANQILMRRVQNSWLCSKGSRPLIGIL